MYWLARCRHSSGVEHNHGKIGVSGSNPDVGSRIFIMTNDKHPDDQSLFLFVLMGVVVFIAAKLYNFISIILVAVGATILGIIYIYQKSTPKNKVKFNIPKIIIALVLCVALAILGFGFLCG